MEDQPTFGDFVLGLEGLAILRSWMTDPRIVKARAGEISGMVVRLGEHPWSEPIVGVDRTVVAGYGEPAASYDDGANPLKLAEEMVVHDLIAGYPAGRALAALRPVSYGTTCIYLRSFSPVSRKRGWRLSNS